MFGSIRTQLELEDVLDALWANISIDCLNCSDPDCMGYVWLTKADQERLIANRTSFVRVNGANGPCFIDSYHRTTTGAIDPSVRSPPCPHRSSSGSCTIHGSRPLVCRMYPLGLEALVNDGPYWVLHTNCVHIRRLTGEDRLSSLVERLRHLIANLDETVIRSVGEAFSKAADLSEQTFDTACVIRIQSFVMPSSNRSVQ